MDVREKLVELLGKAKHEFWCSREKYNGTEFVAGYLVAHGVTVQEWISVKDRLPEEEERVLIYTKTNITNYGTYTKRYGAYRKEGFICQDGFMWLNTASHWMPLPEPPKE